MTTKSVLKEEFYLAKLGTCSFYQGPSTLLLVLVNIIFYTLLKKIMFYTKKTIIIANFNLYIQNPFLAFLWVSIWKMNLKFMFQDYSTLCVLATWSFFSIFRKLQCGGWFPWVPSNFSLIIFSMIHYYCVKCCTPIVFFNYISDISVILYYVTFSFQ